MKEPLSQLLHLRGISVVRQTEIHTAEQLVPEPSKSEAKDTHITTFFDVLVTVHLSIFISLFNQLDAPNFVSQ